MSQTDKDLRLERIAVLIPCFNAGNRLKPVLERLSEYPGQVIVVDDGSTDDSMAGVEQFPVRIVKFEQNQGKGAAMLAGFRAALEDPATEGVVVLDADGQHDSAQIPNLARALWAQHADLVIGERRFSERHVPWTSWIGNTLSRHLSALLLGRDIADTQSGYRLHSRRFLEDIVAHIPPGRYETEMAILVRAVKKGFAVVCVPIPTIYETGNPSSHFHRVKDSYRVWHMLFKAVWKTSR